MLSLTERKLKVHKTFRRLQDREKWLFSRKYLKFCVKQIYIIYMLLPGCNIDFSPPISMECIFPFERKYQVS